MTAARTDREILVERAASAAASAWTASCFAALARERRAVSGGWPGTLSEARVRARAEVARELALQSMAALTQEELAHAARLTNAEARRAWHKNRIADAEPE